MNISNKIKEEIVIDRNREKAIISAFYKRGDDLLKNGKKQA